MSGAFDVIDFTTQQGVKLKARLEGRLAELREQLEGTAMGEAQTNQVRGAISELKALLRKAPPIVNSPVYSGMDFRRGQA